MQITTASEYAIKMNTSLSYLYVEEAWVGGDIKMNARRRRKVLPRRGFIRRRSGIGRRSGRRCGKTKRPIINDWPQWRILKKYIY